MVQEEGFTNRVPKSPVQLQLYTFLHLILGREEIKVLGIYVEIKCHPDATDVFLMQILLLAQHVSGTTMPMS